MPDSGPTVRLDGCPGRQFNRSWRFGGHLETLQALEPAEVLPLLKKVEEAAAAGLHAVGFIAYEAASALNPDLPAHRPLEGLPLAWFAIYRERFEAAGEALPEVEESPSLQAETDPDSYCRRVGRIREYIASGDCYQVNYTFPVKGAFRGDPLSLYRRIVQGRGATFSAYLDTGRFAVVSASPELFFSLADHTLTTRPMKGTARRGRWAEEDGTLIAALRESPKERAENLMIVDLLRNDLGMVAETGSVRVDSLFDIETYPTLHQMTSTVSARLKRGVGLSGILAALFPCGSVTGAPKRRSMEIIGELEGAPRGVYCGAIGYVSPGGEALFSVAIRTLLFDREKQLLSLGIGSGITADSVPLDEYRECLAKAAFFTRKPEEFCLIESLRLEDGNYPLLERHLERLAGSARFFGFAFDAGAVRGALERQAAGSRGVHKVRLLLAASGGLAVSSAPLPAEERAVKFALSGQRLDSGDMFRYHKTTRRELLDAGRSERPDLDEVVFLNERGELTEGSYHNLVLKLEGRLLTPGLECGLLPGVMRRELLESGEVAEATLFPEDLAKAEEIWLVNAVRGRRRAVFVESGCGN